MISQLAVIWYSGLLFISYSTSSTGAYFTDSQGEEINIQAGTWWDKSNLQFKTAEEHDPVESCKPVILNFPLENTGYTMIGPSTYTVYHDGEATLKDQVLNEIKENETMDLVVLAEGPGTYQVTANQRPGYNNDDTKISTVSSVPITVVCTPPKEEPKKEELKKDENIPPENNEKNDNENLPANDSAENKNPDASASEKDPGNSSASVTDSNGNSDSQHVNGQNNSLEGENVENSQKNN